MADMRFKMVLTGGRAGQTCFLSGVQFENGVAYLQSEEGQAIAGLIRYLGRVYKAFPEGSKELKHFQSLDLQREERAIGTGEVQETSEPGPAPEVPSGVQPDGPGTPEEDAADSVSADDPDPSGRGPSAVGDGHEHPGDDGEQARALRIREAVSSMDPEDPENWTQDGLPRVDAVETASGLTGVTRAAVEAAAPGHRRS